MKNWLKKLTFVAGISILLTGCGSQDKSGAGDSKATTDWEKIEEKGEMIVGVDDTFVPMGFRDENDELIGFDIDLANAAGEELGIKIKFQPIDWSMKESELDNGTIDAIWNGYTVTEERKKKVNFGKEYLINEQVLVSMTKNDINSFADMKDKKVGAQEGSSGAASFDNKPEVLKDLVKDNEAVLYPTFTEAFMDLEAGRIQGLVIDKVFAEYYISQKDNKDDYTISPSEYEEENFAVGFRKDDKETTKKVNEAVKTLVENGKAKEISEKWFGEDRILPQ